MRVLLILLGCLGTRVLLILLRCPGMRVLLILLRCPGMRALLRFRCRWMRVLPPRRLTRVR